MDDQDQGNGNPPILPDDGDESGVSPGIFVEQEPDEGEPAEFSDGDSSELDDSDSVDQPGSTIESPLLVDDNEEEESAEPEEPESSQSPEQEPALKEDESDYGQDDTLPEVPEDKDLREGKSACGGIPCQDQCDQYERRIHQRDELIETLMAIILEKNARLRLLDNRITDLAKQVHRLGAKPVHGEKRVARKDPSSKIPRGMRQWQHLLRRSISGRGSYTMAWRSAQQTLNMPIDINMCHPQVRFVAHDGNEGDDDVDEDGSSRQSSPDVASSAHSDEEIRAISPLPDNIIFLILKELLTYEKALIHAFSRLDPHSAPTEFPDHQELGDLSTGLRGRFFVTRSKRSYLSLAHGTEDPNTVLAVLSVSRKVAFMGIHVFYSSNTFAFSSIGEMDRFANGIGNARWQRIQNIELVWMGGKCVKFDLPEKEQLNRRTMPLAWFCEAASLKTLVIHARETHRSQIRRKREPEAQKLYMARKTAGQPNTRLTRSFRGMLGMDYIYQLRGLYWVHVYDLDREIVNPDRNQAKIRDQSFVIDVERVTTQEKVPSRAENSKLECLDPLWPVSGQGWIPRAPDFDRIRPLFHEDSGYDNRPRLNDLDHDATSSQGTLTDSDDSEGEDSDSDSSGSSRHSPPGPSRRRRPFTPAPRAGPEEEDELSETEVDSLGSVSGDDQGKGDSGNDSEDAFEDIRQRYQYLRDNSQISEPLSLNRRARSEGGTVSHIDSDLDLARGAENSSDDEVKEIPAPSSVRLQSRSSAGLFVTPGPGERTTTGTPDTRRRSTSAIQPRRATSASRSASSFQIPTSAKVVDLTREDSDDEGEKRDKEGKKEEEVNSADKAASTPPLPINGTKRRCPTSPPSEVSDTKRRLIERRSLPLTIPPRTIPPLTIPNQSWKFPKDV